MCKTLRASERNFTIVHGALLLLLLLCCVINNIYYVFIIQNNTHRYLHVFTSMRV